MNTDSAVLKKKIQKEIALFVGLLFAGLVIMPVAIYVVGQAVFGAYAGHGFWDFFGTLNAKLRNADGVAWFLILSPNLMWLCLRAMAFAWRFAGRTA